MFLMKHEINGMKKYTYSPSSSSKVNDPNPVVSKASRTTKILKALTNLIFFCYFPIALCKRSTSCPCFLSSYCTQMRLFVSTESFSPNCVLYAGKIILQSLQGGVALPRDKKSWLSFVKDVKESEGKRAAFRSLLS